MAIRALQNTVCGIVIIVMYTVQVQVPTFITIGTTANKCNFVMNDDVL